MDKKRAYSMTTRKRTDRVRTVEDFAGKTGTGMPATLAGVSFRVEIRNGRAYQVVTHRYMLR